MSNVVKIPNMNSIPVNIAKPEEEIIPIKEEEGPMVDENINEEQLDDTQEPEMTEEESDFFGDSPLSDSPPIDSVDIREADSNDDELETVENPEERLTRTGTYMSDKISEKDKIQIDQLSSKLALFLKETHDIDPEGKIKSVLPSGLDVLDVILGGGFGTKFNQIVGMTGGGKSALVSRVIATGQRKWPGKFLSIYIDSEETMSNERLEQLGCDSSSVKIYTQMTVEKVFKILEAFAAFKEKNKLCDYPSLVIWDSIANTHTEKAMETEDIDKVLGQKARVLTHQLPRYISYLNKYNISMLAINQLREKIDMNVYARAPADLRFLGSKTVPGGGSILYNSFQLLNVKQSKLEDTYGFPGIQVNIKTIKNKIFTPNIDVDLIFSFEHGFSNFWTNFALLKTFKMMSVAGGWVKLKGYEGSSGQGKFQQKEAINVYRKDPEFKRVWDEHIQRILQTEFIDKYKSNNRDKIDV